MHRILLPAIVAAALLTPEPQPPDLSRFNIKTLTGVAQDEFVAAEAAPANVIKTPNKKIWFYHNHLHDWFESGNVTYFVTYRGIYAYQPGEPEDFKRLMLVPANQQIGECPHIDADGTRYYPLYQERPVYDDFHGVPWDFRGFVIFDVKNALIRTVDMYINPAGDDDPNGWHVWLDAPCYRLSPDNDYLDICLIQVSRLLRMTPAEFEENATKKVIPDMEFNEAQAKVVRFYLTGPAANTFEDKGPVNVKEFLKAMP